MIRLTKFGTAPDSRCLFCLFDSLRPSQQSFSYVGTGGLNQYYAKINVSCSMTRRSDAGEARNRGPLVSSSQCLNTKCGQSKRFGTGPGWAGYGSRLFGQTHSCHPLVSERKYGHIHGCQKSLAIQMLRKQAIHTFFIKKRGFIPGGAEKGGYSGAYPYYVLHRELVRVTPRECRKGLSKIMQTVALQCLL